ncbi:MAG TPA: DUF4157 domain-containing protein [Pyrinomonadaceae bacterium]|nr:DUF4157 domain-containing protein [Pyrinomonadaceae bacterium]
MRDHARATAQPRRTDSPGLARPKATASTARLSTLTNADHRLTFEGRAARRATPSHAFDGGRNPTDSAPPNSFAHDFSRIPVCATPPESPHEGAAGSPLEGGLRSSLESYFKTSLTGVRVHAGAESQATAERLGASAFTLGQNIHLGPEGVRAGGAARAALLAHEVVHTLQQGPVVPRAKPKVGERDDDFERQADRLAAGFSRFNRDPQDAIALKIRDSLKISHVSGGEPAVQRRRLPTHFGEFEDFRYEDLHDAAGTQVGVEMHLKFHPGARVRADLIGLTQVAEGVVNGVQDTLAIRGERSATRGAGVGRFVDRLAGYRNPLYATTRDVVPGGDAANMGDYATAPVVPLDSAQQADMSRVRRGITGIRSMGLGRLGFRKVINGAFVTRAAELYDTPTLPGAGPNSEQVFETAALAVSGPQNGTYYGSVEWGWRKDAAGAFNCLPMHVVSQGVPSAEFLTAADIWNQSGASLEVTTIAGTQLVDSRLNVLDSIPINTRMTADGNPASLGSTIYYPVSYRGREGYVIGTAVQLGTGGADTIDLPVPLSHTVSNPAGTRMILNNAPTGGTPLPLGNTRLLPAGTRVRTTRCMARRGILTNHYEGEVVDGPHTGAHGFFYVPDLTLEARGTR